MYRRKSSEIEKTLILFAVKFARFKKGGFSVRENLKIEDVDKKELKMGIEVEKEHSPDKETCVKIALDHLAEIPDYYTRLKKMEDEAKTKEEE